MGWIVTIHDGGGSAAEAVDVELAIEMPGEPQAKQFCDTLNAAFSQAGERDMFAQYFDTIKAERIAFPQPDPADAAEIIKRLGRPLNEGETLMDLRKWVAERSEADEWGREFPTLKPEEPDPVTPEEEADAIRRLTGGAE